MCKENDAKQNRSGPFVIVEAMFDSCSSFSAFMRRAHSAPCRHRARPARHRDGKYQRARKSLLFRVNLRTLFNIVAEQVQISLIVYK